MISFPLSPLSPLLPFSRKADLDLASVLSGRAEPSESSDSASSAAERGSTAPQRTYVGLLVNTTIPPAPPPPPLPQLQQANPGETGTEQQQEAAELAAALAAAADAEVSWIGAFKYVLLRLEWLVCLLLCARD